MKHYGWQKMVKSRVFHKLQVACNEEWNIMNTRNGQIQNIT
jgi:hypothetical protein